MSFSYDSPFLEKQTLALHDISFEINPGQRVAIVGPPGCGKTTLLRLLYRIYDPKKGSITLDGYDTRHMKSKDLRQAIAIVP